MQTVFLIFAAFLVWVVVKIILHIIQSYKHLSEDDLFDLMRNNLNKYGPEHTRIIRHLGICEKCQKRLEDYSQGNDMEKHLVDS